MDLIDKLIDAKNKKEIQRLGSTFKTDRFVYFYDTGTGKIIRLNETAEKIIELLFYCNIEIKSKCDLLNHVSIDDLNDFEKEANDESLFQAIKPKELFTPDHCLNIEQKVNNELEQIILELTGKCNQRCKYCIYNDEYIYNRSFNSFDMTKEVAKAAVDYMKVHGKKNSTKAITFYGGEPLMNYDLLKWTIDYSRSIFDDSEISFSFTTNLTLVTKEIASYLGSIPNMHIVASLDGPEEIHNSCRVYSDGRKTYKDAIRGLEYLCDGIKGNESATIMINAVYTPPYSNRKIKEIAEFFDNLSFLPVNSSVQITYPAEGSYRNESENLNDSDNNSLWKWISNVAKSDEENNKREHQLYTSTMLKSLINIQNRFLSDKPVPIYPFNACCIPGARRLYVNTSGDLYVCEKIGSSPSIGNISTGIDIKKLKKYYIKEFSSVSIKNCSKCWAIRMCPFCYTDRFDETGVRAGRTFNDCEGARIGLKNELSLYHSILESTPEKLEKISKLESH